MDQEITGLRETLVAESSPAPRARCSGAAYVLAALLMLAGACMPALAGDGAGGFTAAFPSLTLLRDAHAPWMARGMAAYPAAGALVVLAAALAAARSRGRALVLHLIALLPFLAYYLEPDARGMFGQALDLPQSMNLFLPFGGPLVLAAIVLLQTGNRVRQLEPKGRAGAAVAALGGAYFLLVQALPLEMPEYGRFPVMVPFEVMFNDRVIWAYQVFGFSRVLTLLLLAAAAILAIQNLADRPGAGERARLAARLWQGHVAVMLLALVPIFVRLIFGAQAAPEVYVPALADTLRTGFLTLGLFLLLVTSTRDLFLPRD